jgi:Tn3 transposase DDE domain-containing protein
LAPRFKGIIKQDLILRHWDDFLRLAGSLKLGWVTASLFISKLGGPVAYGQKTAVRLLLLKCCSNNAVEPLRSAYNQADKGSGAR